MYKTVLVSVGALLACVNAFQGRDCATMREHCLCWPVVNEFLACTRPRMFSLWRILTLGWGMPRVPLAAPAIMARPPVLRRTAGSTQMRTSGNCDELSVRISQAVVGFGAAAALFVSPGIRHALAHAAQRRCGGLATSSSNTPFWHRSMQSRCRQNSKGT